jgi:DNA-binding response OmpR family regulator
MKVLVIDDDPDISNLLKHFLGGKGREVLVASDGAHGMESFRKHQPDLVILDVMMPNGPDGWFVLQKMRDQSPETPIIMLTGKDAKTDTARGLLAGADDYIVKPFDLGELEARIAAVLRRTKKRSAPAIYSTDQITIDDKLKQVQVRGQSINLSPKEFAIIKLLASNPGQVFSDEEIIAEVWQNKPLITSGDVAKYIYLLRKKLEDDPENAHLIVTVRGFGYKLAV